MRINSCLVIHFALATNVLAYGSSPCYFANGSVVSRPEIKQCSNGVTTTCCALNRDNPPGNETNEVGWTQDECLPNGLCQKRYKENGVPRTRWWLEYCTNPDPTSSECLDVCRNTRNAGGTAAMTPCGVSTNGSYNVLDDDSEVTRWCCEDGTSCCTNNVGVVELPRKFTGKPVTSSLSSASSAPTTSSATSSPASPTSSESAAPASGNGRLSTGAKAGIGLGATIGVIAIVLAAFFGYKFRRYRKLAQNRQTEDTYELQAHDHKHELEHEFPGYTPSELTAVIPPAEMPLSGQSILPSELPGSHQRYG